MRRIFAVTAIVISTTVVHGQDALTVQQRTADVQQLASLYAKNYAPYEWKREAFGYDLFDIAPWLRASRGADDLEFEELLIDYVASLRDAHDVITFPAAFSVSLGFSADIYEGKVLLDSISRLSLPLATYPFEIGDELVSVDGRPVKSLIDSFRKYSVSANPLSTARVAAGRISSRSQQIMPHIPRLGDFATVAIRRSSDGSITSYQIPWLKTGIPITSQGPVPSPSRWRGLPQMNVAPDSRSKATDAAPSDAALEAADVTLPMPYRPPSAVTDSTLPAYMESMRPLLNANVGTDYYSVLGFGSKFPVWVPPLGFVQRLGAVSTDFFLSGTYASNGVRIGFIRIPTMSPPDTALALRQLDQEIAFFNANTDVLIVDVMRNPGGAVSFVEAVAQRLMPTPFQTVGFEIRATASWVASFAIQLTNAKLLNAPADIVQNLQDNYDAVLSAFNENRGRSVPVSLNSTGSLTLAPAAVTYGKKVLVLADEFSASGADMFAAIIQDNGRGPILGNRTMGAGGSVVSYNGTAYTESISRVTVSLMNRGHLVQVPGLPVAPYIENIGVRPDIVENYMTVANLRNGGAPFRDAFTGAAVGLVQQGR